METRIIKNPFTQIKFAESGEIYTIPIVGEFYETDKDGQLFIGEIFNDYKNNKAGELAHAEGSHTEALGKASHAEGFNTIANTDYMHVSGVYNLPRGESNGDINPSRFIATRVPYDMADYAIAVGNGYSGTLRNGNEGVYRSNAYTLDWSGNATFAGNIQAAGGPVLTAGQQTLTTEEQKNLKKNLGLSVADFIHIGENPPTDPNIVIWINPYSRN